MSKGSKSSVTGFLVVFFGFLAFSWLSRSVADLISGLGVPRFIVGPAMLILLLWLFLRWIKKVVLRSSAEEVTIIPANPMDYQWLNQQELAQMTDAFEASYFVHLKDFTVHAKEGRIPEGFARLFHNPNLHCYAEINQVNSSVCVGMSCSIVSMLDEGWTLSTMTRIPYNGMWVLRKPKAVWTSHPMMTPEQLLQSHLSWRENMTYRLGCQPLAETSFEAYEQYELDSHKLSREILRRRSMLMMLIDQMIFSMSPKMQWMGDYPRAAAQIAKQQGH